MVGETAQEAHPARRNTVVAIGEALWDVFPDKRRPGGAPCNVAFHAARLGDRGVIISRVGQDTAGRALVAFLRDHGVVIDYVQRDRSRATGTVSVTEQNGEPRYAITESVAWDCIEADDRSQALMRSADAVCVGSLAQRSEASRTAILKLLAAARGRALVIFDVNLRPPYVDADVIDATVRASDVVKMSEAEVAEVSRVLNTSSLISYLLEEGGVRAVCVTRGRAGASMTTLHGTVFVGGVERDTSAGDAVGAGDAFTAAMAHQLIRNATPEETLRTANRYAALVAAKKGAMPVIAPAELRGIGL